MPCCSRYAMNSISGRCVSQHRFATHRFATPASPLAPSASLCKTFTQWHCAVGFRANIEMGFLRRTSMTAMLHLIATTIALIAMSGSSSRNADQRHPPLLQMGEAYAEPTQEQKLWALGTCAVLTESNRVRHDMLGGEIVVRKMSRRVRMFWPSGGGTTIERIFWVR